MNHISVNSIDMNRPSLNGEVTIREFNGDNSKVSAMNWLYRFDMLAERKGWSDSDRVFMIGNFLNDEAAEWYITTLRRNEKISFDELKMSFLKRFDIKLVDPLIEFCRLRYDSNKGIRHYFEKKRAARESLG